MSCTNDANKRAKQNTFHEAICKTEIIPEGLDRVTPKQIKQLLKLEQNQALNSMLDFHLQTKEIPITDVRCYIC